MVFAYFDLVKETSTTTGTGNITLGGAASGGPFRAFGSVYSTGDTMDYEIRDQVGTAWEIGTGTFTSPSTLARTTVKASSNSNAAVNFTSGLLYVFVTLPANRFPPNTRTFLAFSGCRVYNTTNQTLTHATWTSITFDSEDFDTDNYHSTSSNTSRITVPTAGYYLFGADAYFVANSTGARYMRLLVNGSTNRMETSLTLLGAADQAFCASTVIKLAAGDYVELQLYQSSGGNLACEAVGTNVTPVLWCTAIGS